MEDILRGWPGGNGCFVGVAERGMGAGFRLLDGLRPLGTEPPPTRYCRFATAVGVDARDAHAGLQRDFATVVREAAELDSLACGGRVLCHASVLFELPTLRHSKSRHGPQRGREHFVFSFRMLC